MYGCAITLVRQLHPDMPPVSVQTVVTWQPCTVTIIVPGAVWDSATYHTTNSMFWPKPMPLGSLWSSGASVWISRYGAQVIIRLSA